MENSTACLLNEIEESNGIVHIPEKKFKITLDNSEIKFQVKASDFDDPWTNITKTKEILYLDAINNLIKKSKFLQLYIQLIDNQITDEEYEAELNNYPDDYFINLKEINSDSYDALVLILHCLPKELSVDDVSEIFGFKAHSLINK